MGQSNFEVALRVKEKFEAYLLGLIFTILGLSIQTAKFDAGVTAGWLEFLSWLLLLLAGVAGLSRMEYIPELYRLFSLQDEQQNLKREGQKVRLEGTRTLHVLETDKVISIDDYIARAEAGIAKVEEVVGPLQKRVSIAYEIMRWAFIGGIVSLVAARAIGPIGQLIGQ